ncbi:MAG: hypothetical protein E6R08_10250 [Nevskiaceae bacterium]|nr:MAG: hypothetical protein E6R08_10250 [Nevskiaceae bacterium]
MSHHSPVDPDDDFSGDDFTMPQIRERKRKFEFPPVRFEKGLCLLRTVEEDCDPGFESRMDWFVIGRLEGGIPFLLKYSDCDQFICNVFLGGPRRLLILAQFRKEILHAGVKKPFIEVRDLRDLGAPNPDAEEAAVERIWREFKRKVWQEETLGEREEDFIPLKVPFAEKESAKSLGARWYAEQKVWKVHKSKDLRLFKRWMPGGPANE